MDEVNRPHSRPGFPSLEERDTPPPPKRARVALACQRCKARKQKCDGIHPSCTPCKRLDFQCRYILQGGPKPQERLLYISALEGRVAELEGYLATVGDYGVDDDHWRPAAGLQSRLMPETQYVGRDEDTETLLDAVRDLSLSASGHYVGGASTITLGQILGSVMKGSTSAPALRVDPQPNPRSISNFELAEMMGPMFVSATVATKLLNGYVKHVSNRYPVLHTPRLRELHARRDGILDVYELSVLHLVYANSGRFLETTGEMGNFFSEQHYEAALQHMDSVLELHDARSVTYLILMATYCLRSPKDPGAWTLTGLAMRLCVELGMHRRSRYRKIDMRSEMDKRIFWACYYLDREVSLALGRPPAISDNDIDVELPFDIGEEIDDLKSLQIAAQLNANHPMTPPTSLTIFIHTTRLKKIESEIQHTVYRVDQPSNTTPEVIQGFLDRISAWEHQIPWNFLNKNDIADEPFDGADVYMLSRHKCVRLLLYPQLSEPPLNLQYVKLCAEACAGLCHAYKRLHHMMRAGYSPLSLQSLFLAGLTLIYCTWLAPPSYLDESSAINDCNIMLYVMTERWPAARKYRDVFERLKNGVSDIATSTRINESREQHARSASGAGLPLIDSEILDLNQGFTGVAREDYRQMIREMAGDGRKDNTRSFAGSNIEGNALKRGQNTVGNSQSGDGTGDDNQSALGEFSYNGLPIDSLELEDALRKEWQGGIHDKDRVDEGFGYWGAGENM